MCEVSMSLPMSHDLFRPASGVALRPRRAGTGVAARRPGRRRVSERPARKLCSARSTQQVQTAEVPLQAVALRTTCVSGLPIAIASRFAAAEMADASQKRVSRIAKPGSGRTLGRFARVGLPATSRLP